MIKCVVFYVSPITLISDEYMLKDSLAEFHFLLLAIKMEHTIVSLWCIKWDDKIYLLLLPYQALLTFLHI